jgi:succinate dehydrogenase / fumarate reductase membrane anchor subunit
MAYVTDRKRAAGLGSAKDGTHHFISMQISSVALIILMPMFLLTFGRALGGSFEEVTAYFGRPFPAIVAGLTIVVGFMHFKHGVRALIEDYTGGQTRKILILISIILSYGAAATGLFAVARLAL